MKKFVSFFLTVILIISAAGAAYADSSQVRIVIGSDLNDDEVASVYSLFGIERGSVEELSMTNAEERRALEGYVDPSIIGTRSISCVYVELSTENTGMDVSTNNITWCTPEMYMAALATAGITDCKVVVAAPFEVSGTSALAGVYKAYEDITGTEIDDISKLVSTQELTITGELAEEIGSMDSTAIVNELKLMLDETQKMSDEEITAEILEIAERFNVVLTEKQASQLLKLCRSLEGLDTQALAERVKDAQNTLHRVSEAKTKVISFINTATKVISSIRNFFDMIADIIKK